MPSLRRTLSSPAVRSSPYPPSPTHLNGPRAAGGHGPRRSSGAEPTRRRVLADIDWWIVQEGQFEQTDRAQDVPNTIGLALNEQVDEATLDVIENVVPRAAQPGSGASSFDTSFMEAFFMDTTMESMHIGNSSELSSPLPQFAALSISQHTPTHRRVASSSQSSDSSFESSPEDAWASLSLMPAFDISFGDIAPPPVDASISLGFPPRRTAGVPTGIRALSYSYVESELSASRRHSRFDDIRPCSPPPFFSTTQSADDDLFY